MRRFESWVVEHVGAIIAGVTMVTLVLAIAVSVFVARELDVEEKIGSDVQVVGPCRTFGPTHPECIEQSRKLFASVCYQQLLTYDFCRSAGKFFAYWYRRGVVADNGKQDPSEQPGPPRGGPPDNPPEPPPPDVHIPSPAPGVPDVKVCLPPRPPTC